MPAEFESGVFVRPPAWHKLGHVIADYTSRDEMMRLAGHDWTLETKRICVANDTDGAPVFTKVEGWKGLQRSDTGKVIAVVRDSYEPIQNTVLWDIVDALVAQPNVKYETAGVLRGGRTLWVMAKLDEPWKVPGDDSETLPYINATTAHDGSHATSAAAMATRIVCWNTWQSGIEEAKKRGTYYAFRHTANVQQRLDEAREALAMVRGNFAIYKELTTELANHPVSQDGVTEFIMRFIPDPQKEMATPRAVTFVNDARAKLAAVMGSHTIPEAHRRTAYGLWCAGIEFLDHERAYRTNDTYFNRCTTPSRFKQQLARLALEVAQ
jgi:phage/plasmid-like protein (TIGR03299 family)